MVQIRRVAITTAVGILTGLYCVGTLLVIAPTGAAPDSWFMVMIFYSRTIQGFLIGFADAVPLHWALRGGNIGALMSIQLCIVPLSFHNYSGAVLLLAAGIIYGALADGVAVWAMQRKTKRAY